MLAYAAAQAENNLDCICHRYAHDPALAAHWLAAVDQLGYPLSEVERASRRQRPPPARRGGRRDRRDQEADKDLDLTTRRPPPRWAACGCSRSSASATMS